MSVRSVVGRVGCPVSGRGSAVPQERVVQVLSYRAVGAVAQGAEPGVQEVRLAAKGWRFLLRLQLVKNRFNARLHYFQGKDIMIDALFPEHPLETLNRWNATQARFTRAAAHKEAKSALHRPGSQLQFGRRRHRKRRAPVHPRFRGRSRRLRPLPERQGVPPIAVGPDGDQIITLTTEKLEEIMNRMKLTPKKQSFKGDFILRLRIGEELQDSPDQHGQPGPDAGCRVQEDVAGGDQPVQLQPQVHPGRAYTARTTSSTPPWKPTWIARSASPRTWSVIL